MEISKTQAMIPAAMPEKLAWLKEIHRDDKLTLSAKAVAVALFMCHNAATGRCNPTQAYLAEAVSLKRQAVNGAIRALISGGWISAVRTRGSSYYRLHVELAAAKMSGKADISTESRCTPIQTADVCETGQQMYANPDMEPSTSTVKSEPSISPQPPTAAAAGGTGSRKPVGRMEPRRTRSRQHDGGTVWPANFELDEHLRKIAERERVPIADIDRVFAGFKAHALDKGRTSNNWGAAWQVWCQTATERRKAHEPRPKVNPRYATY